MKYCNKSLVARIIKDRFYLAVIFVLLVILSIAHVSSATADSTELIKLISQNEDPSITVNDLAYFLAIHDIDAAPKKDYAEVHLNNTIYRLVPNGRYPGLANVTMESI